MMRGTFVWFGILVLLVGSLFAYPLASANTYINNTQINVAWLCDENGANCNDVSSGFGGTPGGGDMAVQFNDNGSLGGDASNFYYNKDNGWMAIGENSTNREDRILVTNGGVYMHETNDWEVGVAMMTEGGGEAWKIGTSAEHLPGNLIFTHDENFAWEDNYAMVITPDKDVGIGIKEPQARLHVYDANPSSYGILSLRSNEGAQGGTNPMITFGDQYTSVSARIDLTTNGEDQGSGDLAFRTWCNGCNGGNGEWQTNLYLLSTNPSINGAVGIGTTDPVYKLEIHDTSSSSSTNAGINLVHNTNSRMRFKTTTNNYAYFIGLNGSNGNFEFADGSGNIKEVITQSGNVGIGTSNPESKLHIRGSVDGLFVVKVQNTNNGSSAISDLYVQEGNVGGGVIAYGTNYSNSNRSNSVTFSASSTAGKLRLVSVGNSPIYFVAYEDGSMTPDMTILGNGNVGIGTTEPSSKLAVTGGDLALIRSNNANSEEKIKIGTWGIIQDRNVNGDTTSASHYKTMILHNAYLIDTQNNNYTQINSYGMKNKLEIGNGNFEFYYRAPSGGSPDYWTDSGWTKVFEVDYSGGVYMPFVYGDSLGGSTRDLYIDSNGRLGYISSLREYKENIAPLGVKVSDILKLEPVRFNWKKDGAEDVGLIAEDVEKVLPNLCEYDENGRLSGVRYSKLPVYLLKVVKEQEREIKELKKIVCRDHPGEEVCYEED